MMAAISGSITVFYVTDVAQAIDLSAVPALVGAAPWPRASHRDIPAARSWCHEVPIDEAFAH